MSLNPNSLSHMISFIGDEKIQFQLVHNSIDGQVVLRNDGTTRFTMGTEQKNLVPADLFGKPRRIGFVLWIDREDVERWQNEIGKPVSRVQDGGGA